METKVKEKNILTLKGKEINLTRLGIDFTLNEQQVELLNKVADFLINKKDHSFTMSGYAGTGKSTLVRILLQWIKINFGHGYDFQITAPTNRAKYVIENLSGQKSRTIHSILGLLPNINIEKLNLKNLKFDSRKKPQIPRNLLIIDESSMINDTLLNTILDQTGRFNCQVLFIGDKAQLKPVEQEHISNVFELDNKYELTKVERQKDGNPLTGILEDVRNNPYAETPPFEFKNVLNSKGEGIEFTNSSLNFLDNATESLKNVVFYTEYLNSRILTFTNARVALYNKLIREKLGFSGEYHQGELLMAYNNVGNNDYTDGLVNSCDYIIENKPEIEERTIGVTTLKGYSVNLVSTDERNRLTQFILSRDNEDNKFSDLAFHIEDLRYAAIYAKKRDEKVQYWKEYYRVSESFLSPKNLTVDGRTISSKSIDYGYAFTTHKSQGGTFKDVYVDYRDYQSCRDTEQRNQLLYVGLSRCTNKSVMFY